MEVLKSPREIEKMRQAGRVVHRVLDRLGQMLEPGMPTLELNKEACRVFKDAEAESLFYRYQTSETDRPYPGHICVSINEEVVHGIPGQRRVCNGDIISVDCGVRMVKTGYCGDAARTYIVGEPPRGVRELVSTTRRILDETIRQCRPGRKWSDIASVIQEMAGKAGLSVIRQYVGHGIGRQMHEDPAVPNYVTRKSKQSDFVLREGLTFAIEPMIAMGRHHVKVLRDGWTAVTKDSKPSAHFEHTVAIRSQGPDVLTNGK